MNNGATAEWISKEDAAAILKTSTRSVERMAAAGKLETAKRQRPGKSPETLYRTNDVMRLTPQAYEMPPAESAVATTPTAATTAPPAPPTDAIPLLAALLATMQENPRRSAPDTPRLWIGIEEASAISGLSRGFLRRLCTAGLIEAVRDQRRWKINRAKLLAFSTTTAEPQSKQLSEEQAAG
jgi:hypothetical protein